MKYSFIKEFKAKFGEYGKFGLKYYPSNDYNMYSSHSDEEIIEWGIEDLKKFYQNGIIDEKKQLTFQVDNNFNAIRYRTSINDYKKNDWNFEVGEAVLESRCIFLKEALGGIDIKPGSLEIDKNYGGHKQLICKGANEEKIRFWKNTRGTGDKESFSVSIDEEKKCITMECMSSFYTHRHIFKDYPDIYEENILTSCRSNGIVFTSDGVYIFKGDFVKKNNQNSYHPNFTVYFYSSDTLNFLFSNDANGLTDIDTIRICLLNQKWREIELIDYLNKNGIDTDFELSLDCSSKDIVTFSNNFYHDPDSFIAK